MPRHVIGGMLFLSLASAAIPAVATDWYYVDTGSDGIDMSFVDKDGIRANAAGNLLASQYIVLDGDDDRNMAALRYDLEVDCRARQWRQTGLEVFGYNNAPKWTTDAVSPWNPSTDADETAIAAFICTKGANAPVANSFGRDYPFTRARQMLVARAKRKR